MPGQPPKLDPSLCRARQEKLRHYLAAKDLDGAVFFNRHYIHSLSGYWHGQPLTPVSLLVKRDGGTLLVTHNESPDAPAADEASSATVERLFSQVGIAFSAKRKNADAETISDIMFTRLNVD